MKIFLGSSTEAKKTMETVASWLEDGGRHTVLRWNAPGVFVPDHAVFEELLRLATEVDGAILIFPEDDETWKRGEILSTTRDNVVLEYGILVGHLGRDSVRRIFVGNPAVASNLLGLNAIRLPAEADWGARTDAIDEAKGQVIEWVNGLSPIYLSSLGADLGRHLAKTQTMPVEDILLIKAPLFVSQNDSDEIRALCSDKGSHGGQYYRYQFDWLREPGHTERRLQRIFVRSRTGGFCKGFSRGEIEGIFLHLDQKLDDAIEVAWVYDTNPLLRGAYTQNLGFAIFGQRWILHWGLEAGTFGDGSNEGGFDRALRDLLNQRWEALQASSLPFDELKGELRASVRRSGR